MTKPIMLPRLALVLSLALGCSAFVAGFQAKAEPPPQAAPQPGLPAVPDPAKLRILIVNSLIALNQANLAGNYTVLRDLGSTIFRATNTDAHLAELFAELRDRKLDLAPIVVFDPKLSRPAEVTEQGILRLSGLFETAPEQVDFDLALCNGSRGLAAAGHQSLDASRACATGRRGSILNRQAEEARN